MTRAARLIASIAQLVNAPTPHPDETLGSVVARGFLLSNRSSTRDFLAAVFGAGGVEPHSALPTHLKLFGKAWFGDGSRETAILKANELTLAPYFGLFVSSFQLKTMFGQMIGPNGVKSHVGLLPSPVGCEIVLRYCAMCARYDWEAFGVSYWHRAHQLPLVSVCVHHGTTLLDGFGMQRRKDHRLLALPPLEKPLQLVAIPTKSMPHRFALLSKSALDKPLVGRPARPIHMIYRDHLIGMGFGRGKTLIRIDDFLQSFTNHHDGFKFLERSGLVNSGFLLSKHWPLRLIRKPKGRQHPALHLLLIDFLYGSWEAFYLARSNAKTMPAITQQSTLPFDPPLHALNPDHGSLLSDFLAGLPISQMAEIHGVSVSKVYKMAKADPGFWARRQNTLLAMQQTKYRAEFLEYCRNHPTANVRTGASRLYAWLFRCDRSWLAAEIAARSASNTKKRVPQRIDWHNRDLETLTRLEQAILELQSKGVRPVRVTVRELGRKLGHVSWLEKKLSLLPLTALFLEKHVEPLIEFQKRRLRYVLERLGPPGAFLPLTVVARYAGLNHRTEWLPLELEKIRLAARRAAC